MMVKKGITEKNLEQSRTRQTAQERDLVKCSHCGRFYSQKSANEDEGKCPHCGN
jgi:transcription initiation factor IIE alpha subunit